MIEVVKLWLDSLGDMIALSTDDLWKESEAAAGLPLWVRVANERLEKTVFAPIARSLDEPKLTPYRAGYAMGIMKWGAKNLSTAPSPEIRRLAKKVKMSARGKRKLKKLFEAFLLRGGFLKRSEVKRSKFIPYRIKKYGRSLENGPSNELADFHGGMRDGLHGLGNEAPGDRSDLATDILLALVMWWRLVVRFKSITQLHAWLVSLMGAQKVGEKKRVEKICERIGLTLRAPGRPSKKIPTLLLTG